jgi:small-conductance mechanosensitive channel
MENRVHRYLTRALLTSGSLLSTAARSQDIDSVPAADDYALLSQVVNWTGIVQSIGVVIVAWLVLRFVDRIVDEFGETAAEHRLWLQRLNAFFHFFVYLLTGILIVLLGFDFSPQVMAIFGGTIVVAVGFATRDLLASLVAGLLIIFDRPFQIGDRVSFGGEYGDILSIGLRSVKLRTLDDSTVTIPNNLFLSEVASSGNSGELSMQTVVDFFVGIDQDIELARGLIREAAATSRHIYLPKPIEVQAAQIPLGSCVAMRLRLKAYVLDTKYEKEFETDVTLRVQGAFADNAIAAPAISYRKVDARIKD